MHHRMYDFFSEHTSDQITCDAHKRPRRYTSGCKGCYEARYYHSDEHIIKVAIFVIGLILLIVNVIGLIAGTDGDVVYNPLTTSAILLGSILGIIGGIMALFGIVIVLGAVGEWLLTARATPEAIEQEEARVRELREKRRTQGELDEYDKLAMMNEKLIETYNKNEADKLILKSNDDNGKYLSQRGPGA